MKIINYGHACFKVIADDVSVIFDPFQDDSVPGINLPKDLEANPYNFREFFSILSND